MKPNTQIPLAVYRTENGFESEEFRSTCECIGVRAEATTNGTSPAVCYRIIGFDQAGAESVVLEKQVSVDENGKIHYEFQLDPVSLAVYQKLVSYRIRLISDALVSVEKSYYFENTDFASFVREMEARTKQKQTNYQPRALKNVLFVGNSILLGIENRYGMCSTSPQKDYYYYVSNAIRAQHPDCQFFKLHGACIEHAESMDAYQAAMYTAPNGYTKRPVVDSLTPDLDLVFLQITDNVNTPKKTETFLITAELLLQEIKKRCPNAQIIWVYGWYLKQPLFPHLWDLFDAYGVESVYLLPLRMKANEAFEGTQYESEDGTLKTANTAWLTHPGDKGMYAIAQKMIEKLKDMKLL